MNKSEDLKKIVTIMNDLAEEFEPDLEISDRRVDRWDRKLLQKYGIKKVEQAADKLIDTKKYKGFPKISDMVEAIEDKIEDIEAIALVQHISARQCNVSFDQNVKFDDVLIHATINAMGGWVKFRIVETVQLHWQEEEFIRKYCIFYRQLQKGYLEDQPSGLIGMQGNSPSNTMSDGSPRFQIVHTNHPHETPKQIEEPPQVGVSKTKNVLKELKNRIKK